MGVCGGVSKRGGGLGTTAALAGAAAAAGIDSLDSMSGGPNFGGAFVGRIICLGILFRGLDEVPAGAGASGAGAVSYQGQAKP